MVVFTLLFLDWLEHEDVYAIGVVNCVTRIGEVRGRASNASLWIRLGYPSPLLRFLHHTVPLFSILPVFSPFSITCFSFQTPPPMSGHFEWNNGTWRFVIPSLTKMALSLKYVISYALALTHFTKTRCSYVCCYLRLTVNQQSLGFEVVLCDLNSEKTWWEWTSKAINGVLNKQEELLSQMRRIVTAPTVRADGRSHMWSWTTCSTESPRFSSWFGTKWLPAKKVQ